MGQCSKAGIETHLNIQEEEHKALEQASQLLRELAHHAWRLLSRLAQRHQELCRKLPRAVFQLCRFRYLHASLVAYRAHGDIPSFVLLHYRRQVIPLRIGKDR